MHLFLSVSICFDLFPSVLICFDLLAPFSEVKNNKIMMMVEMIMFNDVDYPHTVWFWLLHSVYQCCVHYTCVQYVYSLSPLTLCWINGKQGYCLVMLLMMLMKMTKNTNFRDCYLVKKGPNFWARVEGNFCCEVFTKTICFKKTFQAETITEWFKNIARIANAVQCHN